MNKDNIIISNAFHNRSDNSLHFIACILKKGVITMGDELYYEDNKVAEIMYVEMLSVNDNQNIECILCVKFIDDKELKISNLYGKELLIQRNKV